MLEINFTAFPTITTERLVLREVRLDDAATLFRLRTDKTVIKYIDRPSPQSIEDSLAMIHKMQTTYAENNGVTWVISMKDAPTDMIGFIGYWNVNKDNYRAETGYLLDAALHGKGLMQEALAATIHYGFSELKLHSIEADVNPDNAASIKLLERNGFKKEAHFKENHYFNGVFLDSAIYSLLNPAG